MKTGGGGKKKKGGLILPMSTLTLKLYLFTWAAKGQEPIEQ